MSNRIPLAYADVELQLSTAIDIGGTSFSVPSANDDDGVALPAGKYCFTLDNGSTNKEYLIGQLNGTDVTAVYNVSRQGVETFGAVRAHRVGTSCIITDFATIQRVADILRGQVDLDGSTPIGYDAEPTLSDRKDLATVGYVLDIVTGGTVAFDNMTCAGNGGEAIVAGNLVYFKTSDQEWYLTDADTAATVEGVQLGIALGTGSNGVAITGGIQIAGTWTTTGLTAGSLYYAGNTAGAISATTGTTSQVIGLALSTTKLLIIPRNPKTLNEYQISALLGDSTPSSVNKFLTKGKVMVAGATITGATLPVPVYQNKIDNEFYACDANDTAAMKFLGFAISNGTDGAAMNVQFSGIVSGFTALTEGEKYYVQDTAGTIGNTIGTYEILVGVAISETEILIQKGKRRTSGNGIALGTASGSLAIVTGFRPSLVRIVAVATVGAEISQAIGEWCNGVLKGVSTRTSATAGESNDFIRIVASAGVYMDFSITSVTDIGFTVTWTETGAFSATSSGFVWSAEGEL